MRAVLRRSLGLALALPLLSGVAALAPAAFAALPTPAVVQFAPQQQTDECNPDDQVCQEHQQQHQHQQDMQQHGR
ncbi:hypothetical protein [Saccharopolyspora elongata]|uniref:Uncharacterized protein n=1 Tax=Saccharopolyspora elongata TaxID=2530387 RepID=A0A4R4XW24_9PSEU|nr:hypothetical protein [Saccharopolyspora elongata]TDD35199.1 hypothetical protein E1288_43465 [Saccharopolyspora elongata]